MSPPATDEPARPAPRLPWQVVVDAVACWAALVGLALWSPAWVITGLMGGIIYLCLSAYFQWRLRDFSIKPRKRAWLFLP